MITNLRQYIGPLLIFDTEVTSWNESFHSAVREELSRWDKDDETIAITALRYGL